MLNLNSLLLNEAEPISKIMNKVMNLELICCILYGLKHVFTEKNYKKSSANSSYQGVEGRNSRKLSLNDEIDPELK